MFGSVSRSGLHDAHTSSRLASMVGKGLGRVNISSTCSCLLLCLVLVVGLSCGTLRAADLAFFLAKKVRSFAAHF